MLWQRHGFTRTDVVESIENEIKLLHIRHAKLFVFDVAVVRRHFYILVEAATTMFAVRISGHIAANATVN